MPFSENLKKLRIQHGYTQEQLGHLLHISRASISKYEVGNLEPNLNMLIEISRLFGITVDQLIS